MRWVRFAIFIIILVVCVWFFYKGIILDDFSLARSNGSVICLSCIGIG